MTIIIVCVLFGFLCSHLTTVYMILNMHVARMDSALILNLDNINLMCFAGFDLSEQAMGWLPAGL